MFLFDAVGQKTGKKPNDDLSSLINAYSSSYETAAYTIQGVKYTVLTEGMGAMLLNGNKVVAKYLKNTDPSKVPNKGSPDDFAKMKYILEQEQKKTNSPNQQSDDQKKEEKERHPPDDWSITQNAMGKNLKKTIDYAEKNLVKKKIKYSKVKGGTQEPRFSSTDEMLSDKAVQDAISNYESKRGVIENQLKRVFEEQPLSRNAKDMVRYVGQLANWNMWQPETSGDQVKEGKRTEQSAYSQLYDLMLTKYEPQFNRLSGREWAKLQDYIGGSEDEANEAHVKMMLDALEKGEAKLTQGFMGKKVVVDAFSAFLSANVLDDKVFKGGKYTFYHDLTSNPDKMLKDYVKEGDNYKVVYQYDMSWKNKVKGKQGGADEETAPKGKGSDLQSQIDMEKKIDEQFKGKGRKTDKINVDVGTVSEKDFSKETVEEKKEERSWKKTEKINDSELEAEHSRQLAQNLYSMPFPKKNGKLSSEDQQKITAFMQYYDENFAKSGQKLTEFISSYKQQQSSPKIEENPEIVDETTTNNTPKQKSNQTQKVLSTGIAWIDEVSAEAIKQFSEKHPEAELQKIIEKVQKTIAKSRSMFEEVPDASQQVAEVIGYLESAM